MPWEQYIPTTQNSSYHKKTEDNLDLQEKGFNMEKEEVMY